MVRTITGIRHCSAAGRYPAFRFIRRIRRRPWPKGLSFAAGCVARSDAISAIIERVWRGSPWWKQNRNANPCSVAEKRAECSRQGKWCRDCCRRRASSGAKNATPSQNDSCL